MLHTLKYCVIGLVLMSSTARGVEVSFGPQYSSTILYKDDEDSQSEWNVGGELCVDNLIPYIGFKLRGSKVSYDSEEQGMNYSYQYIPLSLCSSFDLLPFVDTELFDVSVETGFGFYFWKYMVNDEVMILPSGEKVDEKDYGFVGGLTVKVKPHRLLSIEFATRYNYIASCNINKYGYFDKDEKLWENGFGVKFIIP
jgi:hypothetical protein